MCMLRSRCLITGRKHILCPSKISCIRSTADLLDRSTVIVVTYIGLVSAVKIAVIFRCHVAAAAPVFITHTKVVHLPRLLMPILFTQLCHR